MNRSKKLYILAGILLCACLATFGVCRYEESKEKIKNSGEVILAIDQEDVTAISWTYRSTTLSFHKDGSWVYDNDAEFPVDEEKIAELLAQFEQFAVSFTIDEVDDYGQYGLDKPLCTINIETEDKSYEILLGDYSAMDEERYVSVGDGKVYLAKNDPWDKFNIRFSTLLDHDEIPSFNDVTEIEFAGTENYRIIYAEESGYSCYDDDVYFIEQNGSYLPLDTKNVNTYLKNITKLGLSDYKTYKETTDDIAKYGLDDPDLQITIAYTYQDEESGEEIDDTFSLSVSRDPKEKKKAASAEEDEDEDEEITAYVRVGQSKIIYEITSAEYKKLLKASYDDLRHKEVLAVDFDDIYRIDIELEDAEYTITSEEKKKERVYYYDEEEIDIAELKRAFNNLRADSFTAEEPTQKKKIALTVYLDNENYPQVKIEFYRYDGNYCLAVVDGEVISLVSRGYVIDLIEAVNYLVL